MVATYFNSVRSTYSDCMLASFHKLSNCMAIAACIATHSNIARYIATVTQFSAKTKYSDKMSNETQNCSDVMRV